MMTYESALQILRPRKSENQDLSLKDVNEAYEKMLRRYPPTVFPDKFQEVRKAYEFLTLHDDYWRTLLDGMDNELSFLFPEGPEGAGEQRQILDISNLKENLGAEEEFLKETMGPFLSLYLFPQAETDSGEN